MSSRPCYRRFAPGPELEPLVESLWYQCHPEATPDAPPTTVLPAGRAELVVQFGDPFEHLTPQGIVPLPRVAVLGQRTRPLQVRATGSTGLIIVGLRPWASGSLLGEAAAELVDHFAPLTDLAGYGGARELAERVAAASTPAARTRVVRQSLARLLDRSVDSLVVEAVHRIAGAGGRVRVSRLAEALAVSRRHLGRRFRRAVGVPPKRLAGLVRVQRALLSARSGLSWDEIVARCGFYDQAHLIGDLKAYIGSTPRALRGCVDRTPLARKFNDRDLSPFSKTVYL